MSPIEQGKEAVLPVHDSVSLVGGLATPTVKYFFPPGRKERTWVYSHLSLVTIYE